MPHRFWETFHLNHWQRRRRERALDLIHPMEPIRVAHNALKLAARLDSEAVFRVSRVYLMDFACVNWIGLEGNRLARRRIQSMLSACVLSWTFHEELQ